MRQRGYAEALLYLVIVAVIAALVVAAYNVVDHRACKRCASEIEAKYAQRDNDALRSANERIKELEDKARAEERRKTEELAAVSAHYQGELQSAKARRDRDVAAARAGDVRLRDPNAASALACGGGETGPAAAGPAGRDDPARGELSREVTANLLTLVDEADEVVMQLAACQAVVRADRKGD